MSNWPRQKESRKNRSQRICSLLNLPSLLFFKIGWTEEEEEAHLRGKNEKGKKLFL